MTVPLALQIREQLGRVVADRQSLTEFEDWFVPAFWSVEHDLDASTRDLGYEIELRLAEYSNGHWTEDDMRRMFRQLTYRHLVGTQELPQTGSASVAIGAKSARPASEELDAALATHTGSASASFSVSLAA